MSRLTTFRSYAAKSDPRCLPPSILFAHTPATLTLFDLYPKSIFHFLVLPRIIPPLTVFDLTSLRTLLKADKTKAKEVLTRLHEDAQSAKGMIEQEMKKRYGFQWDVWIGFHAVPSMEHLHVHVLSADLCSPSMKIKKHYNSFNPKHGFFLHLDEVLSWFDAEESYYETMSELKISEYEPLLKDDLLCWRCGHVMKNMPTLKTHLQEEWDKQANAEKGKLERKRKREEASGDLNSEPVQEGSKRHKTDTP
jgi:aprataxin